MVVGKDLRLILCRIQQENPLLDPKLSRFVSINDKCTLRLVCQLFKMISDTCANRFIPFLVASKAACLLEFEFITAATAVPATTRPILAAAKLIPLVTMKPLRELESLSILVNLLCEWTTFTLNLVVIQSIILLYVRFGHFFSGSCLRYVLCVTTNKQTNKQYSNFK